MVYASPNSLGSAAAAAATADRVDAAQFNETRCCNFADFISLSV